MNNFIRTVNGSKGLTLIALAITIIILFILAGITISALAGNNGLIEKAGKAKEESEISSEKEIVEISTVQALGANKRGNIEKEKLEKYLDSNAGNGKTEVIEEENSLIVKFVDTNRYYEVDENGNTKKAEIVIDSNPGNITIGINNEALQGTEESPFEIWCIEDLLEWSNNYNKYVNNYINLCKNLDFESKLSYNNSDTTEYGDVNKDGSITDLMTELTTGSGFPIIGKNSKSFDGQNFSVFNLHIHSTDANIRFFCYFFK